MTLACEFYSPPQFHLAESIVWSIGILAPIAAFFFLPKLLPLRRELRWTRARLLLPLAWLSSRVAGKPEEARSWRARARAAWLGDVAAHHVGRSTEAAASDPAILRGARIAGWTASALVGGAVLWLARMALHEGVRYQLRIVLALALTLGPLFWLARVGAMSAAVRAGSWALGRGGLVRLGIGGATGAVYGALTGWTAALAAALVFVPALSLLTFDGPGSRDMMYILTYGGLFGAIAGALLGTVIVGGVTVLARPGVAASRALTSGGGA